MNIYMSLVDQGILERDSSQFKCVERLEELVHGIQKFRETLCSWHDKKIQYMKSRDSIEKFIEDEVRREMEAATERKEVEQKRSFFLPHSLWNRFRDSVATEKSIRFVQPLGKSNIIDKKTFNALVERKIVERLGHPPPKPHPPKGIYMYGGVGAGKTMLANMVATYVSNTFEDIFCRRLHCHTAMLELHCKMHQIEMSREKKHQEDSTATQKHNGKARISIRRMIKEMSKKSSKDMSQQLGESNADIMVQASKQVLLGKSYVPPDDTSFENISCRATCLLFDEVQTTDPYNVAAMKSLMETALDMNGIIINTSNKHPYELSRHGLHEDMFDHFIQSIEHNCDIVEIQSGGKDFRQIAASKIIHSHADFPYYVYPVSEQSMVRMEALWQRSTGESIHESRKRDVLAIPVLFGRYINVDIYATSNTSSSAWFEFEHLCGQPLGTTDYHALGNNFDTIFITKVPAMSMRTRDKARRFINLVDEMYNTGTRLVVQADVPIHELFAATRTESSEDPILDLEHLQFEGAVEGAGLRRDVMSDGSVSPIQAPRLKMDLSGEEEKFAFKRAISRLFEMQIPTLQSPLDQM